jgi:hypothetical protein
MENTMITTAIPDGSNEARLSPEQLEVSWRRARDEAAAAYAAWSASRRDERAIAYAVYRAAADREAAAEAGFLRERLEA